MIGEPVGIPKPIEAVIKGVYPDPGGKSWTVTLAHHGDLWLTVHKGDVVSDPQPGDMLTIQPPYVIAHTVKP